VTGSRRRVTNSPRPNPLHQEASADPVQEEYANLVRSAAAGDTEALDRLLLRAQEVAWRFSTSVCGHADDAEDAMQEALIKTYRYVARIPRRRPHARPSSSRRTAHRDVWVLRDDGRELAENRGRLPRGSEDAAAPRRDVACLRADPGVGWAKGQPASRRRPAPAPHIRAGSALT